MKLAWTNVLTLREDAEQKLTGNKEDWIDALSRSTEKRRRENCEDRNGTILYSRAVQRHGHGAKINPETPLNWKEHIFHTGSSSNFQSIPDN